MTLSITLNTICRYAECRDLCIVILNVVMLSVIMLNVVAPLLSGTLQGFAVLPETLDLAEKVCQGQKYF